MKILVDENIPGITVAVLREQGHDVLDLRQTEKEGSPDADVWRMAQEQGRLLVTTDKGFSRQWTSVHAGILLVILRQPNRREIHRRILLALEQHEESEWGGLLVTMKDRVQIARRRPE